MALPNAVNGGSVSSSPAGTILVIHAPAATVSGWQDYYITEANFLAAVNNSITTLAGRVTVNEGDISDLQDLGILDKTLTGLNTATTKNFDGNSMIEWVGIKVTSGPATVKMGTGSTPPNDDNIIPSTLMSGRNVIRIDYDTGGSSVNLNISVSGGTADFSFKIIKNILT